MSAHTTDKSETIYLGCDCHSPEHIIRVSYYDWLAQEQPEFFFELQADAHLSFWKRVKMAYNYVFFGKNLEWHDVVPTHPDLVNLKRVVDNYHKDYKLWHEAQDNGKNN